MKLRVEIPASIVNKAYDRVENSNKYDSNGNYLGIASIQRSFIPIWILSEEKGQPYYQDELNKLTKAQLLDYIREHYSVNKYEMEILA